MTQIRSNTSIHLWQGQPTATGHRGDTSTWVNLDATPAGSGITIHGTPAQIAALGLSIIEAASGIELPDATERHAFTIETVAGRDTFEIDVEA